MEYIHELINKFIIMCIYSLDANYIFWGGGFAPPPQKIDSRRAVKTLLFWTPRCKKIYTTQIPCKFVILSCFISRKCILPNMIGPVKWNVTELQVCMKFMKSKFSDLTTNSTTKFFPLHLLPELVKNLSNEYILRNPPPPTRVTCPPPIRSYLLSCSGLQEVLPLVTLSWTSFG